MSVTGVTARILLVDDDPWILRMVRTVLERRGHLIFTAGNGEEALARCDEIEPDLVITDVSMPKMDGWALVRNLRARPRTALVPVIFLTALNSDEDRIKGFRLGADDYLPKPFRFEELDLRVANTLRRAALAAPPTRGRPSQPDPAAFRGSLGQVGVASLLTLLDLERKSGELELRQGGRSARLLVREGRVIRALAEGDDSSVISGADCVYALLQWSEGDFSFVPGVVEDTDDEIKVNTTTLLLEGARRIDERRA